MRRWIGLTVSFSAALVVSLAAWAQSASSPALAQSPPRTPQDYGNAFPDEPGRHETVRSRSRPEVDPLGIRLGGFFLYPELSVSELYRDNIFYTDTMRESDFITVVSPDVQLRSNWNNHALNFYSSASAGFHIDNTGENYFDWRSGFNGRLDIDESADLRGGFDFSHLHEDRSSPDQTGAAEPVEYDRYGPYATLSKRFNRLNVSVGGEALFYDYSDVPASGGGTLNFDDRDRLVLTGDVRVGYEILPDFEAFIRGRANDRDYDSAVDDNGFNRDSSGWEIVGGVSVDFGGLMWGNVYFGYISQSFDDPALPTIDGVGFGGDVTWNPTELTTVRFEAERTVAETTLTGAAGALQSRGRVVVDHELRRNVIVSANALYQMDDYNGIMREDETFGAGVAATYLMNRYLHVNLAYSYDQRSSNVAGADYVTNSIVLRLSARY